MFNVQLSSLLFALIAAVVITVLAFVGTEKQSALENAERELEEVPARFQANKQLRETQLRDFARGIAHSELGAYLRVLTAFQKPLDQVDHVIFREVPGDLTEHFTSRRAQIARERFGESVLSPLASKLVSTLARYRNDANTALFRRQLDAKLSECIGRGSSRCEWHLIYDALCRDLSPVSVPGAAKASDPCANGVVNQLRASMGGLRSDFVDLVLVFDSNGVGLASAQDTKWSQNKLYRSEVMRLKEFMDRDGNQGGVPVYFDLLAPSAASPEPGALGSSFLVAIVPVPAEDGSFAGAVLVGTSISGKLVEYEKKLLGVEMTYILQDKPLASTFDEESYPTMLGSTKVAQRMKRHRINDENYFGLSIPYFDHLVRPPDSPNASGLPAYVGGAAYGASYQRLRVLMARNKAEVTAPFRGLQTAVPVVGLMVFLIGGGVLFLLIRHHLKPFEDIDSGIHEVINGNLDYQFDFDFKEEFPSSMAQSLNLMTAVLLGKPLPEDEEQEVESWEAAGLAIEPAQGPTIADDPAKDEGGKAEELASEPAEAYYRRLFEEYRQARVESGDPDDSTTFVRFVELVARSERSAKARFKCEQVRYVVRSDEGRVVLHPVALT